jgi:uncharacterized protein (TIGR01777 family)
MRVLVTGATGFIGRALVPALRRDGHSVVAWVRSAERARHLVGAETELLPMTAGDVALIETLGRVDAVVNLAGEPVVGRPWTAARRRTLWASRVDLTARLVRAMLASAPRPRVLVSASAVGYYGDRGAEPLSEDSAAGSGFLSDLSAAWEAAALPARERGVRVVLVRIGIVLGRGGGMLEPVLPVFRFGLGGSLGSGRQAFPWIHLHDLVGIITRALVDPDCEGPINAAGPEPATNRGFSRTLGAMVRRPAVMHVPSFGLRLALGDAADVVTASQHVVPAKLQALKFAWMFPTLESALRDVAGTADVQIRRMNPGEVAAAELMDEYLRTRPPGYVLRTKAVVDRPIDETFAFFADARNLGLLTPRAMRFTIDGPPPAIVRGTTINYRLRVGPAPVRWRTRITAWDPPHRFVDVQEAGPYRCWWHEHTFRADGMRTVMEDRVLYAPPFGSIGRIANLAIVRSTLREIFTYRRDVIGLRFGRS